MKVRQTHSKILDLLLKDSGLSYEEYVTLHAAFDLLHDTIIQNNRKVPDKLIEDYGTLWANWALSNEKD